MLTVDGRDPRVAEAAAASRSKPWLFGVETAVEKRGRVCVVVVLLWLW